MLYIDIMSRTPVYEQIINQMERLITAGLLKEGEQLPSVRALSLELSVNPNTIQKAYSELEMQGVIMSLQGRGSIILADKKGLRGEQYDNLVEKMRVIAKEMHLAGITEKEFVEAARAAFGKIGGSK